MCGREGKMKQRIIAAALAVIMIATLACCDFGQNSNTYEEDEMSGTFINTEFADGIIPTAETLGISISEYLHGEDKGGFSYSGNRGVDELSVIFSPYFTLTVNGISVPVYATIVHDGTSQHNLLASFAIIEVREREFSLKTELSSVGSRVRRATVLPAANGISPNVDRKGTVKFTVREFGNFNVLTSSTSSDDFSSDYARNHSFTLFVREYVDEEAEIAAYKKEFGEENVTVYEPGLHVFDYINISSDNRVLYFKRGCYMFSKGRDDYGETNDYFEKHRGGDITWNLTRFPVINANGRKNIVIAGNGWIDGGGLGWHERRGILLSYTDGIVVKNISVFNMPEWSLITYVSKNITIRDCRIFGYKTNSDGFAICNSQNATVTDCFARSGDDLFEIKTLGGPEDAVASNVTFTSCTAWASKARCFGIIAETERDISDITFRDCSVIYRDSTWDNDFLGSLMVYCEKSKNGVNIDGILFENIEIWCDRGRAINVKIEDEKAPSHVRNVTFRNVTYTSSLKNLLYSPDGDYVQEITLENVRANGTLLTPATDLSEYFDMRGNGKITHRAP